MMECKNCQMKRILSFLLWFSLCYCSYAAETSTAPPRNISEGKKSYITDFPYMLSLEIKMYPKDKYKDFCGAIIIHHTWAITEAYCGHMAGTYMEHGPRLRSGSSFTLKDGTLHYVETIVTHPQYDDQTDDYDVSIMKVSTPFEYSDVAQSILMTSQAPSAGTPAMVLGWGWAPIAPIEKYPHLRQVNINIVSYQQCKISIPFLTPRMLCAADAEGNIDVCCFNIEGAAIVADNRLVGITTMYWLNGSENCQGVYIDVAQIRDWVAYTLEEEQK